MEEVAWTITAKKNLWAVHRFIAEDSERYALEVVEAIITQASLLAKQPGRGKIVPEFNLPTIRELKLYSYRIIYKVTTDKAVVIVKVWHESRMLKSL